MVSQSSDFIDHIYENIPISNSIICCSDTEEMSELLDILESKSYPLFTLNSLKKEDFSKYPNKMFISLSKEFNSKFFYEYFMDEKIECIIFVGRNTFLDCINTIQNLNFNSSKQFIFTI